MTEPEAHVLVVAHRTAASPRLIDAVRRRAQQGPCRITLLVPRPYWDPDTEEAELVVELAVPVLEEAAGRHVDAVIGESDPVGAVRQVLATRNVDEIIVSTLPKHLSKWLKVDVAHKVAHATGLPVRHVEAHSKSGATA